MADDIHDSHTGQLFEDLGKLSLLDQIIANFIPDQENTDTTRSDIASLASLSRVSRKLHRITESNLYHTIPLFLAKSAGKLTSRGA